MPIPALCEVKVILFSSLSDQDSYKASFLHLKLYAANLNA